MQKVKVKEDFCQMLQAANQVLQAEVDSFIHDDQMVAQCLADRKAFQFSSGYISRSARSPLRK